jgi:hypothetical protein
MPAPCGPMWPCDKRDEKPGREPRRCLSLACSVLQKMRDPLAKSRRDCVVPRLVIPLPRMYAPFPTQRVLDIVDKETKL